MKNNYRIKDTSDGSYFEGHIKSAVLVFTFKLEEASTFSSNDADAVVEVLNKRKGLVVEKELITDDNKISLNHKSKTNETNSSKTTEEGSDSNIHWHTRSDSSEPNLQKDLQEKEEELQSTD